MDTSPQDRGSVSEVEACVEHVSTRLLSPSHHFAMKLKSHLVMLYDARWGKPNHLIDDFGWAEQ